MATKYQATLVRGSSHTLFGVGKFIQGKTVVVDEEVKNKLATAAEVVTITDGKGKGTKKELPKFKFVKVGSKPAADETEEDEDEEDETADETSDESESEDSNSDEDDGDNLDDEDEDSEEASKPAKKVAAKTAKKGARRR